jgi:hypothetical protein
MSIDCCYTTKINGTWVTICNNKYGYFGHGG